MLKNTTMKEKMVKSALLMGLLGLSMFLLSFFMSDASTEKMCLWVATIGVGCLLVVVRRRGTGVKMLYASILFWVLSRMMLVYQNEISSNVFSAASSIFLVCFIVKAVIYFNKYCTQDVDVHLDDEEDY